MPEITVLTPEKASLVTDSWYGFKIPNLPRDVYEYLKVVRVTTGLSPWQVVIVALKALEHVGTTDRVTALRLVEDVKGRYPKP